MIETHQLGKRFRDAERGEVRAVQDVTFRCGGGQIYGLLGANGAGKTTTLRMLATILAPTEGRATIAGFDAETQAEQVRRNIGFLSTATALYARLTAEEMVQYFGRLHGMNESRTRRCDALSTGMKQKVSIARTLVHDPPVMIFDEPTGGLDVMTARTIMQFIRDCRQKGKTVIVSTHVMSEVEKLGDRIGIINGGRLLVNGTLVELREKYGIADMEEIFVRAVEGRT